MDLPVKDSSARPRMADGTADWETIFEHPDSGLVPLVSRARSVDGLKACATLVINQLFTRKNDAAERERLNDMLVRIMARAEAEGGFEIARDGVIELLRSIKQERLLKAATYVAKKQYGGRAIERRRKGGAFLGDVQHLLGGRGALIAAVVVLTLCVAGIVGYTLIAPGTGGGEDMADSEKISRQTAPADGTAADAASEAVAKTGATKPATPDDQAASSTKPEPEPAPPSPPDVQKTPPPEFPKTVYFKAMYWAVSKTKKQRTYTYYQPAITVVDKSGYLALCRQQPSVNDALYLAMSRAHPAIGKAGAAELARAGQLSMRRLEQKIGRGAISRIDFLRDGDPLFRPNAVPCR